jgi:ATP-dependent DNA helicase RecG
MRGPGNFFGNEQHGLPKLQIADLHADMAVLKSAQEYSQMIITKDPGLDLDENRALRAQVRLLFQKTENSI